MKNVKECTLESLEKDKCISCNIKYNYYPFYNESNNNDSFIDCFNKTNEGFFFNNETKRYEKCYNTCKYCFGSGNDNYHNCSECNSNYIFMNGINCYKNYSYYYYYNNSDKKYYSTDSYDCPENYKLIQVKFQCIENCFDDLDYKFEFNNKCYTFCPFGSNSSDNKTFICKCKKYYDIINNLCIEEIPEGYYFDGETLKKCDVKCFNCSFESISQNNSCLSCNINKGFYPKFENNISNNLFNECYNYTPYGYYFQNDSYIVDKRCDKYEEFNFNNICPKYYYCDSSNNYFCIEDEKCPENYPKFIKYKKKCINNCENDNKYKYEYKNNCYEFCPKRTNISSNNIYLCEDIYIYDCSPIDFFAGKCKLNKNANETNNNPKAKDEMINNINY